MDRYTTQIQIDGSWQKVLIYKSVTPIVFEELKRHCFIVQGEYGMDLLTYVTEPQIYRQFEPTENDNHYYYWFIVKETEKGDFLINGERVKALEDIRPFFNIPFKTLANLTADADGNYNLIM